MQASDVQIVWKRKIKRKKEERKKIPWSDVPSAPVAVVKRAVPAHDKEMDEFEANYRLTRKGRGFYPSTKAVRQTQHYRKFDCPKFLQARQQE